MCADHIGLASTGIVRQSLSYTWFTADSIGKGATAVVYKGRNKSSGDVYAIKVFNDQLGAEYSDSRLRELQLLQTIKHENVIQFIAVEKETISNATVVVMEYCEGGSLYSMLENPKYLYGLPEEEFLLVIHDVSSGMQYLREQDIVHRDIKPGNIMRFIKANNRSLYKLTDFGAARYLDTEENFTSLYGTEEYLHPGMFKRAVLHQPTSQRFDATVDLWSLGVTLYHIVTGQLPFQPYGGRNNSHTMYKIITEKAKGVISGLQSHEGAQIIWSNKLPPTCSLSSCLQSMLVPILAGLMEANEHIMWNYHTFFRAVAAIIKKKTLKIFNFITCVNMIIYLEPDTTYTKLQETIALETEIPAAEQILLSNSYPLDEIVSPLDSVKSYPKDVLNGQLFLFPKEGRDPQRLRFPDIPSYPDISRNMYMSLDKDVRLAQVYCNNTHFIKIQTETAMEYQKLLRDSTHSFRTYVKRFTKHIEQYMSSMDRLLEETKLHIDIFYNNLKFTVILLEVFILQLNLHGNEELEQSYKSLKELSEDTAVCDVLRRATNRVAEVNNYMALLTDKLKEQMENAASVFVGCEENRDCVRRVERLCDVVTDVLQVYKNHKNQRVLTEYEKQVHQWEKSRLEEISMQAVSQLQSNCRLKLSDAYNFYLKQIVAHGKSISRLQKVEKNIQSVMDCQQLLSTKMKEVEGKTQTLQNTIQSVISTTRFVTPNIMTGSLGLKIIGEASSADSGYLTGSSTTENVLEEIHELVTQSKETMEIAKTNTELLEKLQQETVNTQSVIKEERPPT